MLDILDLQHVTADILSELQRVKRPLLIYGAGVGDALEEAEELQRLLGVPLVVTWGARSLFPNAESFGTHGLRSANFAVQTADYIISVGTRLDTKATGSPASSFAPQARLTMVDIDAGELEKMALIGRPLYRSIRADAGTFLRFMSLWTRSVFSHDGSFPNWSDWAAEIDQWKIRFPAVQQKYLESSQINPYALMEILSQVCAPDDVIVADTGCGLAWLMQAFKFKGQKFVHAFNQTPMGYGLPAAVGAAFATGRRVVLVTGDGGLAVNIGELATVAKHQLPIKIILLNNHGHAMCRQTQRQWLRGEYPATSAGGGLATPDFLNIALAFDIPANRVESMAVLDYTLRDTFAHPGSGLLECVIPDDAEVSPQIVYGQSLFELDQLEKTS